MGSLTLNLFPDCRGAMGEPWGSLWALAPVSVIWDLEFLTCDPLVSRASSQLCQHFISLIYFGSLGAPFYPFQLHSSHFNKHFPGTDYVPDTGTPEPCALLQE